MPDEREGGRAKKEKMNGAKQQPGAVAAEPPILRFERAEQTKLLVKVARIGLSVSANERIETEIASVKRLSLRRSVSRSLGGRERKPVAVRKSVAPPPPQSSQSTGPPLAELAGAAE